MPTELVRPDFSDYVVHFTKGGKPLGLNRRYSVPVLPKISALGAFDRLVAMLRHGVIYATNMPWTDAPCVCFTECVWGSLLTHAQRYSPYGIGFKKEVLFQAGGGPAIYVRRDLFEAQRGLGASGSGWHPSVWPFLTPFIPQYSGEPKPVDFTHEREWRVPHDFSFVPAAVAFVVVNSYEDEARMPKALKDAVGRENILIMDNYRKVNRLWPWHHY